MEIGLLAKFKHEEEMLPNPLVWNPHSHCLEQRCKNMYQQFRSILQKEAKQNVTSAQSSKHRPYFLDFVTGRYNTVYKLPLQFIQQALNVTVSLFSPVGAMTERSLAFFLGTLWVSVTLSMVCAKHFYVPKTTTNETKRKPKTVSWSL